MIRAGQQIKCPCGQPVFVAKVDLQYRQELRSQDMRYPNGLDVEYRAPLVCPRCGTHYRTINSETGELQDAICPHCLVGDGQVHRNGCLYPATLGLPDRWGAL